MNKINFISGGMLGDFIHSVVVVKNICEKENCMARIYLTDKIHIYNGDVWKLGVEKACQDLSDLIVAQPFVERLDILPNDFDEPFVNLSSWRVAIEEDRISKGYYYRSWSEFLSGNYKYEICPTYKWINTDHIDDEMKDKIAIHRSLHRHNPSFGWNSILDMDEEFVFVTCSIEEWERFPFKNDKVKLKLVSTIDEMAICINSCKYFIGNQSAPFALASALDVPRLAELDYSACAFYMNEIHYSKNISWYLRDDVNTLKRFYGSIKAINETLEIK